MLSVLLQHMCTILVQKYSLLEDVMERDAAYC